MILQNYIRIVFICCVMFTVSVNSGADTSDDLWRFQTNVDDSGIITFSVELLDIKNPPPDALHDDPKSGIKIEEEDPAETGLVFDTGNSRTNGTKFSAGYYRGPLFSTSAPQPRGIGSVKTNRVTIFTTGNRENIYVAVDHGPLYLSTNWGTTWSTNTIPGTSYIPLSTASDGSGFYARIKIEKPPLSNTFPTPSGPFTDWYAVGTSGNGSKLVVTGNSSQLTPALIIRYSNDAITLAWPAELNNLLLEHRSDLNAGKWIGVTNVVQSTNGENRVKVSPSLGNDFFRLRSP